MRNEFDNELSQVLDRVRHEGVEPGQIGELEQRIGVTLPEAVRVYLRTCGCSPDLLGHLAITCESIEATQQRFSDVFKRASHVPQECSKPTLALCQDESDVYYYLTSDDPDDPPVCVLDNELVCVHSYSHFSEMIIEFIKWYHHRGFEGLADS